jgi:nucleotide-binding universal stress UspA family protein
MAIETILLAVGPGDADRARRLAEETVDIAGPTGATVVLLHVFTREEYDETLATLDFDTSASDVSPDEVATRHRTVRSLETAMDDAGIDFEVRGNVGEHGAGIVEAAEDVAADLVVVGGRRRSPAGKAVFGSTAQEVMLEAPCPVMFVRADTK